MQAPDGSNGLLHPGDPPVHFTSTSTSLVSLTSLDCYTHGPRTLCPRTGCFYPCPPFSFHQNHLGPLCGRCLVSVGAASSRIDCLDRIRGCRCRGQAKASPYGSTCGLETFGIHPLKGHGVTFASLKQSTPAQKTSPNRAVLVDAVHACAMSDTRSPPPPDDPPP